MRYAADKPKVVRRRGSGGYCFSCDAHLVFGQRAVRVDDNNTRKAVEDGPVRNGNEKKPQN